MLHRFYYRLLILIIVGTFASHAAAAELQEITVSAAMSLKNSFSDIGKAFEAANTAIKVTFNFGSSGDLTTQIQGGAPVDVFASAALKDMDALNSAELVVKDTMVNFVSNSVVLVKPVSSKVRISSFEDLKRPDVKKIAIGNPMTVPAGRYADEVFESLKLNDAIKDKLVFAENVRQVLDYAARGEVDAGVVYSTDAKTRSQDVAIVAAAPEGAHKPVLYPIAVVRNSGNEKAARAFISFVRSEEGKKILERNGFRPVK
jgi:molybdate transport system substrate-binding protein